MTTKDYLTISENTTHEITIKKSRFICSLARVKDEAAAKDFIDKIKNIHRKATHNCFAYQIGADDHIHIAKFLISIPVIDRMICVFLIHMGYPLPDRHIYFGFILRQQIFKYRGADLTAGSDDQYFFTLETSKIFPGCFDCDRGS